MGSLGKFFRHSEWGQSLILLLGWNIIIRLIAVVGYFLLPERFAPLDFIGSYFQSNFLLWSFANFDGEHYLSIAKSGYSFRGGFPQYAFFPLLPLLISFVTFVIREPLLAGLIVTQGSLWVALVYLRRWTISLKLVDIRWPLLISTAAIFLASVYTEPLFIAFAAMTMYFSEKKWWGRAVITTALSTATRINGIFLAAFLVVKLMTSNLSWQLRTLYAALSTGGLMVYMCFLALTTGDPLNFFHSQGAWGKATATSPLATFLNYGRSLSIEFIPDLVHLVVIFEVIITLLAIGLFIHLLYRRQLGLAYWVYLLGNLAMPILTGSLGSMPRFFVILFPLLTTISSLPRIPRRLYYLVTLMISITGVILFTRGYWYG